MAAGGKRIWFGILLSVLLVVLLLRGIDPAAVGRALAAASYAWIVPLVLLVLSSVWVRAYRWKFLVSGLHRPRMNNLFSATMIGFMANFLLPVRMGEVIRAYLLARREPVSTSAAFATIVVERLFDILTMLLILAAVLVRIATGPTPIPPVYTRALRGGGLLMLAALAVALVLIIGLKARTEATVAWIQRWTRPLPPRLRARLQDWLQAFLQGLTTAGGGRLTPIVLTSLLLWGIYGVGNLFLFRAFHLHFPFYTAFYLLVVQAFGVALPSSPGFVGTYHAAVVAGLVALGMDREQGLGVAIVAHAAMSLPVILYGLVLLWRDHLSLRSLRAEAEVVPDGAGLEE